MKYLCEHGRLKYVCVPCGGAAVCEHGQVKYRCRKCGNRCEHGRALSYCRDCGNGLCEHENPKANCKTCNDYRCKEIGCRRYNTRFAGRYSLAQHNERFHSGKKKQLLLGLRNPEVIT